MTWLNQALLEKIIGAIAVALFMWFMRGLWYSLLQVWKKYRVRAGLDRANQNVTAHRRYLAELMAEYYKTRRNPVKLVQGAGVTVPLLTRDEWVPPGLVDISWVNLVWKEPLDEAPLLWPGLAKVMKTGFGRTIENRLTYRLVEVAGDSSGLTWTFGPGHYEDYIESGEAMAWELAGALKIRRRDGDGPATVPNGLDRRLPRRLSVDAFDFGNRSAAVGINTLTIIVHEDERLNKFVRHARGVGQGVRPLAEAARGISVVPAGTFQPVHPDNAHRDWEFSLKRNVMREFGEELLGKEEFINDPNWLHPDDPFKQDPSLSWLKQFFDDGSADLRYLGLGLDCVTLKPEVLTLLILNGHRLPDTWHHLTDSWEGAHQLAAFNQAELRRHLTDPEIDLVPAAAGCLALCLERYDEVMKAARELLAKG